MGKKLTVTLGDIDQKMVNVLPEVNSKNFLNTGMSLIEHQISLSVTIIQFMWTLS